MTRLLFLLVATLAATYAEILEYPVEPPSPSPPEPRDPLTIDPNTHPKDTLSHYLNNLTRYIYDLDAYADADPRTAFFNQKHPLRIYETLNHFVEENYGFALKSIPDDYRFNSFVPLQIKEKYLEQIVELEGKVAEMFLQVIYGNKPIDQERLQQVQKKMKELVYSFAKFATWRQVVHAYHRLKEIHLPVLENFNNVALFGEENNVKRGAVPVNDTKLQEELTASLKKLISYVYGNTEAEILSPKISMYIQPLGSLISFQRFLEANYRLYLNKDYYDYSKGANELRINKIKKLEEKTTALWFEALNYTNQTVIDDIKSAMSKWLDEYFHFRNYEDIKEILRKVHEVYGHLFKDVDQSSYLNLMKLVDHYRIREFPELSEPEGMPVRLEKIHNIIKLSEKKWQSRHEGASSNENKRIRELLRNVSNIGLDFLEKLLRPSCEEELERRKKLEEIEDILGQLGNVTNSDVKPTNEIAQLESTFG